jgi:hypothetical protein
MIATLCDFDNVDGLDKMYRNWDDVENTHQIIIK